MNVAIPCFSYVHGPFSRYLRSRTDAVIRMNIARLSFRALRWALFIQPSAQRRLRLAPNTRRRTQCQQRGESHRDKAPRGLDSSSKQWVDEAAGRRPTQSRVHDGHQDDRCAAGDPSPPTPWQKSQQGGEQTECNEGDACSWHANERDIPEQPDMCGRRERGSDLGEAGDREESMRAERRRRRASVGGGLIHLLR